MLIHDLETPALIVDLGRMARNIERMQGIADAAGVRLRPHMKTHKTVEIARMQLDAGAKGIAAQKVSEARVFADAGINDLQIPYNIVGPQKTAQLAELALFNQVTVSVDSLEVVAGLAAAAKADDMALRVLVDLETPMRRTGASGELVVQLAQQIEGHDSLHFAGVTAYPADLSARPAIQDALYRLNRVGIGVDVVSGGGTGAALGVADMPELTEIRAGTYVFNDWRSVLAGWAEPDDCALTIVSTVVSRPGEDRAIIDAGSKTLSSDGFQGRETTEYGVIVEYPHARIYRLSEEHGFVDLRGSEAKPSVGERVTLIPAHVCTAVNLHDQLYAADGEAVETVWHVAARGRVW